MKILFVYSVQTDCKQKKPLNKHIQINFGISYVAAYLKHHGHTVSLVVLNREQAHLCEQIVNKAMRDFSPELVCFTAVFSEYSFIATIAEYIKNNYPKAYLLIGGCHVSLNPDTVDFNVFDAVCVGEGEFPTLELVTQLENSKEPSGIANLWLKTSGEIQKNKPRPVIDNLDELPFPERDMWEEWIDAPMDDSIAILLGRGCPFECTYCCNHVLKKIAQGAYVRFRSPENIIKEIESVQNRFSHKRHIYFEVESFGVNKQWAFKLCELLEQFNKAQSIPFYFGVNLRVTAQTDFDELFKACRKSNFKYINIGLESGSFRVRKDILNRQYTNDAIIQAVTSAHQNGLKVIFYVLIGVPGETAKDFQETIKIMRLCKPDSYFLSIFYPYPGTVLYDVSVRSGLDVRNLDPDWERSRVVLNLPTFPAEQIMHYVRDFEVLVYPGRFARMRVMIRRIARWLYARNLWMRFIYRKLRG